MDVFVVLDDVQYTRRDWRNRNRIKTKDGVKWLTIPVDVKGRYTQSIDQTRVSEQSWAREHAASLRHAYGRAPFFAEEWKTVEPLYEQAESLGLLSEINMLFIRELAHRLNIATPVHKSSEFDLVPGKNERLIAICKQLGASQYLSGPAAREYMDEEAWRREGIEVVYKSYAGYPEYDQLYPPFDHAVTVLDLLFHTGPQAPRYLKSAVDVEH